MTACSRMAHAHCGKLRGSEVCESELSPDRGSLRGPGEVACMPGDGLVIQSMFAKVCAFWVTQLALKSVRLSSGGPVRLAAMLT